MRKQINSHFTHPKSQTIQLHNNRYTQIKVQRKNKYLYSQIQKKAVHLSNPKNKTQIDPHHHNQPTHQLMLIRYQFTTIIYI